MVLKVVGRQIETLLKPVGTAGEHLELVFLIPRYFEGKDLSQGTVYMVVGEQTHYLAKAVEGDAIKARWTGSFPSEGQVAIALKISDMEAELWRSLPATIYISQAQAPVMMRTFAMMRTAVPDDEEPITVSERTILVPEKLRKIAVQNDENSETVKIVVPRYFDGHDLDQYEAILKTISSGGRADLPLEKSYTDDAEIAFSWTLAPPQTSYAGELRLQIRFVGGGFKWETEESAVQIIESGDAVPVIPESAPDASIVVDQEVTAGSSNAVSSSAVKNYVDEVLGGVQSSLNAILNGGDSA